MITEKEWKQGGFVDPQPGQIHNAAEYQKARVQGIIPPGSRIFGDSGEEYVQIGGNSRHVVRLIDGCLLLPALLDYPIAIEEPR